MKERPPKLDPKKVSKRMIELQTRLRLLKRSAWAYGSEAIIAPNRLWGEESKLKNRATGYTVVVDKQGWKVSSQLAARAIIPEDPLYTEEANTELLQKYANLVKDHIHVIEGMTITGFEVENEFVLNSTDPDLVGSVLTVTICALPGSTVTVSSIVRQLNALDEIPEMDLVAQ